MESNQTGPAPAKKSGLPALAWIAIGCGGLIALVLIAVSVMFWFGARQLKRVAEDFEANPVKQTAEMLVRLNPELELVRSDDKSLTVRLKKTGEVGTFDFEQIRQGKLRFKNTQGEEATFSVQGDESGGTLTIESEKGKATLGAGSAAGRLPSWVLIPPGSQELQTTFTLNTDKEVGGAVTFTSAENPELVLEFYREQLKKAGYELQLDSLGSGAPGRPHILIAGHPTEQRTMTVTISQQQGPTQVILQYSGKLHSPLSR